MHQESLVNCPNYSPLKVVVKAAHEAIVTDIEDRDYIDCIASYSAINQGHLDSNIKNCYLKNINGLTVEN